MTEKELARASGLVRSDFDVKALYRALNEPAWVIDPDSSRFLDANGEAIEQLGFSRDEVLSLAVTDINKAVPDLGVWQTLTADMRPGDSVMYMADLVCKSGTALAVEIALSCQLVDGKKVFLAVTRSQPQLH